MSAAKTKAEEAEEKVTTEATVEPEGEETTAGRRRSDEIVHALQELGKVAGRAGETLRQNVAHAPDAVRDGIAQTEDRIRDKPLTAIGIAAGVGLLLGLLINRGR